MLVSISGINSVRFVERFYGNLVEIHFSFELSALTLRSILSSPIAARLRAQPRATRDACHSSVMSNILLSVKSGSDWTDNELDALNIQVNSVEAATFFNMAQLPDPLVSPVILTNESRPQGPLAKRDRLFFQYLKDAVKGEESYVDDFAAFILAMFEYDEPERVIHQRKEVSFVMCGMMVYAKPDICVMSESEYLLLVQGDKVCPSFSLNRQY